MYHEEVYIDIKVTDNINRTPRNKTIENKTLISYA